MRARVRVCLCVCVCRVRVTVWVWVWVCSQRLCAPTCVFALSVPWHERSCMAALHCVPVAPKPHRSAHTARLLAGAGPQDVEMASHIESLTAQLRQKLASAQSATELTVSTPEYPPGLY